jgi:ubiquinone/menaquinone biosynthesis C-methylase UbiE
LLAQLNDQAQPPAPARIEPVLGQIDTVPLAPRSVDLALLADTYHELAAPDRLLASLCEVLRPGGWLAIAEYRAEDARVPIPMRHKMSDAQILRELAPMPLVFERRTAGLPWQHLLVFRRS